MRMGAALVLAGVIISSGRLPAGQFEIRLEVQAGKKSKTLAGEEWGIGVRPKPRQYFVVDAASPLTVKWSVQSSAGKDTRKDVIVHFYVVKIDKKGQLQLPKLDRGVVAESALTMDFKPKDKATGEMTFEIEKPGVYLLRLETIGAAAGTVGHEHHAAVDLEAGEKRP